jgi:hypothetical protein
MLIQTLTATRYVTPLREGGSLPAIVQVDGGEQELYVMKFVGAGQGVKALVAEIIAGEIGRALGLPVPELALIRLDPALAPSEPNEEISDLLRASVGLNLGLRFLPQAFDYNSLLQPPLDPDLASAIVWFDAYVTNVDRMARNTNILVRQKELWLIDHGAALYFHHDWRNYLERSQTPFPPIKDHRTRPSDAGDAARDRRPGSRRLVGRRPIRGPGRKAPGLPGIPAEQIGSISRVCRRGQACPIPAYLITQSCASCPGLSRKSSSTRG